MFTKTKDDKQPEGAGDQGQDAAQTAASEAPMATVYALDLLHEAGQAYQAGEPVRTTPVRAQQLIASGICAQEQPRTAAPSPEADADYQDKMMRLGKA